MEVSIQEVDLAGRALVVSVCLAMTACATATDPATTTATQPPDPAPSTSTTLETTTTTKSETTVSTSATTTSTSTTTTTTSPASDVTVDPEAPEALSGGVIPWADVGPGWHVVVYSTDTWNPGGPGDYRDGPDLLYLVSPGGTLYEGYSWPSGRFAGQVLDVRPDGTAALVATSTAGGDTTRYEHIDLVSGTSAVALERDWPETSYLPLDVISFTRPIGLNYVVHESDGTTERLVRLVDGSVAATLFEQDLAEGGDHLTWLYGYEGTTVVVGHRDGMDLVSNTGVVVTPLWVPEDHACDPVRWWDADTVLTKCRTGDPGEPYAYYHQLWFIPRDGSAGTPLTTVNPIDEVVDFGFVDAWFRSAGEIVQWTGDCGASAARWWDGGTGASMGISLPGVDGWQMLGIYDVEMGVFAWEGCGGDRAYLYSVNTETLDPTVLVAPVGRARGVVSAVGLVDLFD